MAAVQELRHSVSLALAEELDRLVPSTAPASLAELRIDYVVVLGWLSGLVLSMLSLIEAGEGRQGMTSGGARR